MKKRNSYYSGQLVMFDGIKDGKSVCTFLSEVVLTRLSDDLYMNVATNEKYVVDNDKLQEGDILCKVKSPLLNLKNNKDVEQYILSSPFFFKDRMDIYMNLMPEERKLLQDKIVRDIEDNTKYHQIINEQGPIVRAYAKVKK